MSIDRERYRFGLDKTVTWVEEWIDHDVVLSFHPEWLFEKTEKNQRGPVYDVLKTVLKVDKELETVSVKKKSFFKIAHDVQEYEKNIIPSNEFVAEIGRERCRHFHFS